VADVIATARLDLVALEPAILALIERDDVAAVERELSLRVPAGWTQTIPSRLRLEQLVADPSAPRGWSAPSCCADTGA
jgi:hypothetical protein